MKLKQYETQGKQTATKMHQVVQTSIQRTIATPFCRPKRWQAYSNGSKNSKGGGRYTRCQRPYPLGIKARIQCPVHRDEDTRRATDHNTTAMATQSRDAWQQVSCNTFL